MDNNHESLSVEATKQQLVTTTALLSGLLDADNQKVWVEFDARYRPMIEAVAVKLGLIEADAADVAQETLTRFFREYRAGKYDRSRGRLRSWILAIVRYRVADIKRARLARRETRGESAIIHLPDGEELEAVWESERRRVLLWQALSELRESSQLSDRTMRAFELYVLQERSAEDVAEELNLTRHDVYMAKNRVAERLREILKRMEELFDDG